MSAGIGGRWRKRDDRTHAAPIGAAERKATSTLQNTLLDTLRNKTLTGSYTGAKGETYELHVLDSGHANSSTWSVARTGNDGISKKFTIWFDEPTQRVWWGSWTYYFDPAEAAETGSINWYKLGPGRGFEWHREATEGNQAHEDVPVVKEIKGYSLPGTGVIAVRTDFKPPPGLDQPAELQLFTELPEGQQLSGGHSKEESKDHKADDETSAGSEHSPHDTDTEEPSEPDERHHHSHASNWTSHKHNSRPTWQVKGNEKPAHHVRAPEQRHGHWQPQLRRRGE